MPSSVKDRLTQTYEHIFHFVKSRRYYYDLDTIREPHKTSTIRRSKYPRGGVKHELLDDRWSFNRRLCNLPEIPHPKGKNPGDVFQAKKEPYIGNNPHRMRLHPERYIALNPSRPMDLSHPLGKNPGDTWKWSEDTREEAWYYNLGRLRQKMRELGLPEQNPKGRNPGDFWSINTKPFKGAHFAVYPLEICIRPILSSSPPNGVVLDPMCGSGTTCVAAKMLGRRYIGVEIVPGYVEMARRRLNETPSPLDRWLQEGERP
jgi:hypothetical protein